MKLLTMPARPASPAAVLPQVWATEGNLATAVAVMTASGNDLPAAPAPRSPLRVVITPETAFYRKYTEAMLRRYGMFRLQKTRVPSLLNREMFRGKVTSYRIHGFDDAIIFVTDVERCIGLLLPEQQRLVVRVAVQEYTLGEAAGMFKWSLRSTQRRYHEAIDELTAIFQKRGLMEKTPGLPSGNACQGVQSSGVAVTYTE